MIDLPKRFELDVEGKDTNLTPLIIIDDKHYVSTSGIVFDGNSYQPLLSSIGSIKESFDPFHKKFKISSVSISLFNIEHNDEYLSTDLFRTGAINKKLNIYWKSQSAKNIDDCLRVYSGFVQDVFENSSKLEITAEIIQIVNPGYKEEAEEKKDEKKDNQPVNPGK